MGPDIEDEDLEEIDDETGEDDPEYYPLHLVAPGLEDMLE